MSPRGFRFRVNWLVGVQGLASVAGHWEDTALYPS